MTLKLSTLALARTACAIVSIQCVAVATPGEAGDVADATSWRPVVVSAAQVGCLLGADPRHVAVFACTAGCKPIPWQFDERDGAGELVLDRGPLAGRDDDDGAVDANDELVWMWSDMGDTNGPLPDQPVCADEVEVTVGGTRRRVLVALMSGEAPRSPVTYVEYDVAADRMYGARVSLTFEAPTARGLALRTGVGAGRNLLDRLKIRAKARFFGVVPLRRDEDDIESVYEAWRTGPVRIVRRERKWVELAFGFRTPYMRTETTFYRDHALLPVRMRLNFAPSSLLSAIEVRASLDFVDLAGWRLWLPELPGGEKTLEVGKVSPSSAREISAMTAPVIALAGDDATFALALRLGPSLQSLSKTVIYSERAEKDEPESVAGTLPAIGYRLTEWGDVAAGPHWFVAESYALPAGVDPVTFTADLALSPEISVRRRGDLGTPAEVSGPHLTGPAPIH